MTKLGTKKKPLVLRINDENRAYEIIEECKRHGLHFVIGIEPDKPEDISDLERALGLSTVSSRQPIMSVKISRNEPCPCGSGKKYKKCCGSGSLEA